jgi:2-haloalkanoic acid dehalogenase type II
MTDDYAVLTFDCYGTLIDWESGMIAGLAPLIDRLEHEPSRDEVLEAHARHESAQQRQTPTMPYRDLLTVVYRRIAEGWGLRVSWEACERDGDSVGDWPAFPDSSEALRYLQEHYRLVILSNVDHRSFAGSQARLGVVFDAVYTAQDIGSYKPADANFVYLLRQLEQLGFGRGAILHTAESLFHDHAPANRHGLASCWIHRRHDREGFGATMPPDEMPRYDLRFPSMAAMAEARRERGSLRQRRTDRGTIGGDTHER